MPSRIVYLPLEPYRERYTEYQSVPGGTIETGLHALNIAFQAVRPDSHLREIKTGRVLDTAERASWAFAQTVWLLNMVRRNLIDPVEDVILLEDFWHPGFEMIPYTMSLVYGYDPHKWPRIYSYCYAQSVDPNDFTYGMSPWMRPMEVAWSQCQSGIFVADAVMRDMLVKGGVCPYNKIHVTGLFYNGRTVASIAKLNTTKNTYHRRDTDRIDVIYSSRWDAEKNPMFFIRLVRAMLEERPTTKFVVTTGARELRSNQAGVVDAAYQLAAEYPENFVIHVNTTKTQYFELLRRSKIQFNCSLQDFVSYTLLDATLCGCTPLYPDRLTFPNALENSSYNLYADGSLISAKEKMLHILSMPMDDYSWVYRKYEDSVHRAVQAMGFDVPPVSSLEELNSRRRN